MKSACNYTYHCRVQGVRIIQLQGVHITLGLLAVPGEGFPDVPDVDHLLGIVETQEPLQILSVRLKCETVVCKL